MVNVDTSLQSPHLSSLVDFFYVMLSETIPACSELLYGISFIPRRFLTWTLILMPLTSDLLPPSTGTSAPCTWASRAVVSRSTGAASTGPWCTSTLTSTCCAYWRPSWRAPHSWCCSSASWSRRTAPRPSSVREWMNEFIHFYKGLK